MLNIEQGFGRLGYINQLAERYRLLFKSEAATAAATEGGMHSSSFAGDTSLVELALQRAAEAAGAASVGPLALAPSLIGQGMLRRSCFGRRHA